MKVKVGLALGGGAARGMAHIGVLKAFEEAKIPIDVISGTSMGAIIGGKYALVPNAEHLQQEILEFLESDTFKKAHLDFIDTGEEGESQGFFFHLARYVSKKVYYTLAANQRSMIKGQTFWNVMGALLPNTPIELTRIPFAATAVDLRSGNEVVLKCGSMRTMVAASCALPGIVPPVEVDEYELVDGGWLDIVPATVAREMGADLVIGVWVGSDLGETRDWESSIDILARADEITRHHLGVSRLAECDLVITPDVGHYSWAGFEKAEEIIAAGEEAARKMISEVKGAITKARLTKLLPGGKKQSVCEIPLEFYDS